MKILSGCYDLTTNEYSDSSVGVYSFSDDSVELYIFGSIYTGDAVNDGKKLCRFTVNTA